LNNESEKAIVAFAPGGGFVFASFNNIQVNVPLENVIVFSEAVYEYGRY
jgi:hypothetical protein